MADEKTFTKDELDAAVTAAVEKATGDVDGLKTKNEALIADKKRLAAELRKTQDIKPEDVAALEHQVEELQGKLTAAEKTAKDAITAAEKATRALETESAFTQKLLVQDGIKSALIENGVKDADYIDSLSAKFASGASIAVDGDARKAMFGDKPLGDHIKEWAASEAGKKFVEAPANSGGGSPGHSSDKGGGKTVTRSVFDGMDQGARASFSKEGGKVVDA